MEKRTVGIIATIIAVVLCGCPGLGSLCWGVMMAVIGVIPGSEIDVFGSSDPAAAVGFGLGGLCLGVIFIAIPIIVGIVMLRKPKEGPAAATPANFNEPLPPAS